LARLVEQAAIDQAQKGDLRMVDQKMTAKAADKRMLSFCF